VLKKIQHVHFVGIGGSGMSGIAEVLLNLGYTVSGSDQKRSGITDRLVALGARILDSGTGRFLQRDPVMNASSSVTAHPYAFAWNNPVAFADATGSEPARTTDPGGAAAGLAALGKLIESHSFIQGEHVEPVIQMEWACDYDHNCMKAVEETYGLTDFEKQLKEEFHTVRRTSWKWAPQYRVVLDRDTQAVLGYAFFLNNIDIYDRTGKIVSQIGNEPALTTPLISPIDFVAGGLSGFVRSRLLGTAVRGTATAVEEDVIAQTVKARSPRLMRLPQYQVETEGFAMKGSTDLFGDIYIRPDIAEAGFGSQEFVETLFHEKVHRFFTPRFGRYSLARAQVGQWFYRNSHLMAYIEEALAEGYGTKSLARGLAYPILNEGLSPLRIMIETLGATGAVYGGYRLTDYFFGPSDSKK